MNTHTLHVISCTDPLLTDVLGLALNTDPSATWHARIEINDDEADHIGILSITSATGDRFTTNLNGSCITCAVRAGMIEFLEGATSNDHYFFLPAGIELAHLCPGLADELHAINMQLGAVMHAIDSTNATTELLTHIPVAEHEAGLTPDDERCLAEIHALNLGYADLILLTGGHDTQGGELVEHLRAHDTLMADPFEDNILAITQGITHDLHAALERIHPATVQAWGGPDGHGTWTLDLTSERAFHPERLFDFAESLGSHGVCARGCFWLASRPSTICSWDALGGQVAISPAGEWDTSEAHTHIIIVGIGDSSVTDAIEAGFMSALATQEEMLFSEAEDGLDQWLGSQTPNY